MKATSKLTEEEYLGQHLLEIADLVETKIGHELNLINHRISWLATSQSFLFVAVATLFATYSNETHSAILVFLFCLPVIGLALCIQVFRSVRAALKVLTYHLLSERAALVTELNRLVGTAFAPLGPDRLTDFEGALPAKWIPSVFIVSWLVILALLVWLVRFP